MQAFGYRIIFVFCFLLSDIVFISCKNKRQNTQASLTKEVWTCSMHPEIIRDKPGLCPICGMELIKKEENAVAISSIKINDVLQPADKFILSSIPVTTITRKSESIESEALGAISYDTRLVNTISARVSGRIEKLYVKYRYQHVMGGTRIMDIYSPEILTAEEELLFLIKNDPGNSSLINAAKQKLLLLGMSEGQLHQVAQTGKASPTIAVYSQYSGHIHEAGNAMPEEKRNGNRMDVSGVNSELPLKEGTYVEKGQVVFQIYNVERSLALLNIFPEYAGLIRKGDAVRIIPETAPAKDFRAKIDFIEPFFREGNKTLSARVYFDNSKLEIPVGSQVRATVFMNGVDANWLPRDAVLSMGTNEIVFLKMPGGFKAHKVETALAYKNKIQILSGLRAEDSVAANAQFLIDSESFIKTNNQP